jgi:hypothetical protein
MIMQLLHQLKNHQKLITKMQFYILILVKKIIQYLQIIYNILNY